MENPIMNSNDQYTMTALSSLWNSACEIASDIGEGVGAIVMAYVDYEVESAREQASQLRNLEGNNRFMYNKAMYTSTGFPGR